jgi:hypothetical protein
MEKTFRLVENFKLADTSLWCSQELLLGDHGGKSRRSFFYSESEHDKRKKQQHYCADIVSIEEALLQG